MQRTETRISTTFWVLFAGVDGLDRSRSTADSACLLGGEMLYVCVCVCAMVRGDIWVCPPAVSRILLDTAHTHSQTLKKEWRVGWMQMLGVQRML